MDEKKICDTPGCFRGEPPKPLPLCTITIVYPEGSPDQPTIKMNPEVCANPEIALAILLTALLKANVP